MNYKAGSCPESITFVGPIVNGQEKTGSPIDPVSFSWELELY